LYGATSPSWPRGLLAIISSKMSAVSEKLGYLVFVVISEVMRPFYVSKSCIDSVIQRRERLTKPEQLFAVLLRRRLSFPEWQHRFYANAI
jgi:hypothetical protein